MIRKENCTALVLQTSGKSFFFMINHAENFKRVFLKTIFFETVIAITRKLFDESS